MSLFIHQIFLAIAEYESFTQAAAALHLTPPAVSHAVSRMERLYGLRLFVRDRNGAQLTEEGKKLLPHMRAILNAEERLNQEISRARGLDAGIVRIGTFNSACSNWIPDIVMTFREKHPNIEMFIYQGGYGDILGWLRSGFTDMGFLSLTVEDVHDLDITPICRDQMICVAHKDFVPQIPGCITKQDIERQSLVALREGYDDEANAILQRWGIHIRSGFSVENDDSIIALVESGFGLSILPELVLARISHNAAVYPLHPPQHRIIGLATVKRRPMSVAAEKMRGHILELLQDKELSGV